MMSLKLGIALLIMALFGAPIGYGVYHASFGNWSAQDGRSWHDGAPHGGTVHGAPGPIAGAGLPILAVGYGVYWLVRRRRKVQ
jgi:hypothetical protein